MENILVTGGCGFIGSNFIRYLLEESDFSGKIVNVDKLTYAGNPENLADIEIAFKDRYRFIKTDICDYSAMNEIFTDHQIDGVCHFAAESHVDRSIIEPDAFIKTNINGTFNLLQCARFHKERLKLFHHVSTDEVYGSLGETGFFTEETPYRPNSPYSASKAASDHLVRAYAKTYQIPITLSNCSNNYGPYQFPEKLIPLIILNALEGKPLPVYGDGRNVRDWLYVRDHAKGIWTIMKHGARGETYNIGGHGELTNLEVVYKICDMLDAIAGKLSTGERRQLIVFVKDRPGHDWRYAIDFSKFTKATGWLPEESFESGLRKTIEWYLGRQDWVERVRSGQYLEWIKRHYG